jgi:AsmA protein
MRKARILGYLVGGIVVLLAAVLLAVRLFVDPNNYKGNLAAAVRKATGRELQLPGDIKLSVVPWVALEVGPARLGNPPGFGNEPFVAFSHATVRVKLLPLLHRRLEVSRVELDGLDLRLLRNAAGRGNWQDAAPTSTSPPRNGAGATASPSFASIANITIHEGRLSYQDLLVEHLNVETGSAALHRDIPVTIKFDAHRGADENIVVTAKFDVGADSSLQHVRLAAVNLSGTLNQPGEDRPILWELSAPAFAANLAEASVQAAAFTLSYAGAHLSGSATAANMFEDVNLTGSLTVAPLVPREFAPRIGMEIPATHDPKAWSLLSGSTDFAYKTTGWTLRNIRVHLDDTQLQGSLKYSATEIPALQFDLSVDHIDLDRYRPLKGNAAGAGETPTPSGGKSHWFAADGRLTAAAASFAGLELTDLKLTVASKDRVTRIFPVEAQIDSGRYAGDVTLDDRGAIPSISIDEHLKGIDLARLLAHGAQKGRWSGRATLSLKGTARGDTMDAMLKTMSGHFDADLANGALEGIDLEYQRDRAQALIDRTTTDRRDTKRTSFDALRTSGEIANGIAQTHDLIISTQALKVTGQGSANLSTEAIDFQLLASILKAPTKTLIDIPLKVTGTYADPAVKADIDSLAKDQVKQKLKDILKKNGLQGLFGK